MTRLIIKTVPDFSTKSKEKFFMPEETHKDLHDKINYLQSYRDSLNNFYYNHPIRSSYESVEHGRTTNNQKETRKMSARKMAAIVQELSLMDLKISHLIAQLG